LLIQRADKAVVIIDGSGVESSATAKWPLLLATHATRDVPHAVLAANKDFYSIRTTGHARRTRLLAA
jgi:hypothetical protein